MNSLFRFTFVCLFSTLWVLSCWASCLAEQLTPTALREKEETPTTETKVLRGVLAEKDTQQPLPHTHIYTFDRKYFTLTDKTGHFSLAVKEGDTLIFSNIGYHVRFLVASSAVLQSPPDTLWMHPTLIHLQHVLVKAPPLNMNGFYDHQRLHITPTGETYSLPKPSLTPPSEGIGIGFNGLISYLANQFNAEYKQLKKLNVLKKEEEKATYYHNVLHQRIPVELLTKHTQLLPHERDDFFAFWQPSVAFLQGSSDYLLIEVLQQKEQAYAQHIARWEAYKNYPHKVTTLELRKIMNTTSADNQPIVPKKERKKKGNAIIEVK